MKAKKQVARTFTEAGKASICFMCRLLELPRSSFYALSKVSPTKRNLELEIVKISEDKPRYGYRRVAALMRRSGKPINVKRVQRVRSRHALQVRKKQRKTRRIEPNSVKRLRASKPNEVWSWDFVYDQTANGQSMRILSVVDEYTRQCFSVRPRRSYRATDVIEVLDELILENGSPVYLRSDNGPEFIAYALQDHLAKQGINTHYIKPGSHGNSHTWRASMTSCVMNCYTERSFTAWKKRRSSSDHGGTNTMPSVHTARWTTKPQTSMQKRMPKHLGLLAPDPGKLMSA